jgi:hypothetical protein
MSNNITILGTTRVPRVGFHASWSSEENETPRDGRSVPSSAVWNNFTQIQLSGTKDNKHVQ